MESSSAVRTTSRMPRENPTASAVAVRSTQRAVKPGFRQRPPGG